MAIQLCRGCHDTQTKHPGAKDLMADDFRDSCVWGRYPLIAYSSSNNRVSRSLSQKPSKRVGQLAVEIPGERNSITAGQRCDGRKTNKRPHSRLWFSGQVWCVEEEPDLNKTSLCKLPFLKCDVLTSCMVHFVVSLSSLETHWEWGNLQIWCQDRQIYVTTASLQLLSITRWSSHSHTSYSCHCHTINFATHVCVLWTHISI